MLTCKKLHEILNTFPQEKINSHVHTHLCDGRPDMTVANIAAGVDERNINNPRLLPGILLLYVKSLKIPSSLAAAR
jgi:hypothetical protein